MLYSMDSELQLRFNNTNAYDMVDELKARVRPGAERETQKIR